MFVLNAVYRWVEARHPLPSTLQSLGLDPRWHPNDNNSTEFLGKLGDLLVPGPPLTKVNDFQAILVDSRWSSRDMHRGPRGQRGG